MIMKWMHQKSLVFLSFNVIWEFVPYEEGMDVLDTKFAYKNNRNKNMRDMRCCAFWRKLSMPHLPVPLLLYWHQLSVWVQT